MIIKVYPNNSHNNRPFIMVFWRKIIIKWEKMFFTFSCFMHDRPVTD